MVVIVIAGVKFSLTTIETWLDVTDAGQSPVVVILQLIISVLFKVVLEKVAWLFPVFTPFTCHWYDGLTPELIGVAVKTTAIPWQTFAEEAEIVTDGGGGGVLSGVTVNVAEVDKPISSVAVMVTGMAVEPVTRVPTAGAWP